MIILPILSAAFMAAVAYLLTTAVQQYGHYETLQPATRDAPCPALSVIIPARNEEQNISHCLTALLAQNYPADRLEILVIDDNSSNGTAATVRTCISAAGGARLRLITGAPLPAGWMGKPFACWQGALAANGDFLCFMDADTQCRANLLRAAVATALDRGIDLLSLEPFQVLGGFWERVIFPAGFLLMAQVHDLKRIHDPAFPDAVANGQFMLLPKGVYLDSGGHSAVRHEVAEDGALARLIKGRPGRLLVMGAEPFIETRMYVSLGQLWAGMGKVFVEIVGSIGAALLAGGIALLLAVAAAALPVLDAAAAMHHGDLLTIIGLACAALATATLLGTHMGIARHLKIPVWYGLLFPLGYVTGALLAFYSAATRLAGRPFLWKGRPTVIQCDRTRPAATRRSP